MTETTGFPLKADKVQTCKGLVGAGGTRHRGHYMLVCTCTQACGQQYSQAAVESSSLCCLQVSLGGWGVQTEAAMVRERVG